LNDDNASPRRHQGKDVMSRYDRWVSATSRTLDVLALIFLADVTRDLVPSWNFFAYLDSGSGGQG
jgi:hypothetical protein